MVPQQSEKEIIHKEFELERMILFSDAVFAIAITLLIIDVKFPGIPKENKGIDYFNLFLPTIRQFLGLCLSFFFIGMFWSRHLKLFKYLKQYNNGVIARNLFFLFFIVTFPFSAEAVAGHISPHFIYPLFIYMLNILLCFIMHTLLCNYIFFKKPQLAIPGHNDAKKYIYLKSKYASIIFSSVFAVTLIIWFVTQNFLYINYSIAIVPLFTILLRKKLKKLKPKVEEV